MENCSENPEYEALKQFESTLVDCLEREDVLTLARQAFQYKLIPNSVKTNLEILDPSVSLPLMCRYLIFNAYNSIFTPLGKTDELAYKNWLKALSHFKKVRGILHQMKEFKLMTANSPSVGRCCVLTGHDISDLTEVLAECSSKWKEIATSLGLPHNEIQNIMAMMHMYAPVMCLKEVLSLWVSCKYPHAKPSTLESLTEALGSQIVGLGAEACQLRHNIESRMCSRQSFGGNVGESNRVISQTEHVNATEGNAVLIEVQFLVPGKLEACKWYKDEHAWEKFYGSNIRRCVNSYRGHGILISCLLVKDITLEGSYQCKVSYQGGALESDPIVLTVITPIDDYLNTLTDFYTEQPEVPEDTWPPVSSTIYINLALIKQEGIHLAGEYGRCTIRGNFDDILKDKESIDYKSAFLNLSSGERLLVEGRPGSGKTTLVHKVSQDWAKEESSFCNVKALFLVHLRAFSSNPNIDLHDILKCYYSSSVHY